MDFFDRIMTYDRWRKQLGLSDVHEFYQRLIQDTVIAKNYPNSPQASYCEILQETLDKGEPGHFVSSANNNLLAEWNWIKDNKPYYKIWPEWIIPFAQTRLDLPSDCFVLPFKSILLRLPKANNPLVIDEEHKVQTILATEFGVDERFDINLFPDEKRTLIIWVDVGEKEEGGSDLPVYSYLQLPFSGDELIEDAILRLPRSQSCDYGLDVPHKIMVQCLKLCVSISFLATGADKLVQPDVLSKDLARYYAADNEMQHSLVERARRRGKRGWKIGTKEIFLGRHQSKNYEPTGVKKGSLHYQHQRGAHFHVVRYGPGKKLKKVKLYRQTTVKPDLPPPPVGRGYRAKK